LSQIKKAYHFYLLIQKSIIRGSGLLVCKQTPHTALMTCCITVDQKLQHFSIFFYFSCTKWQQVEAWSSLFAAVVEVKALAQGALSRFTQWVKLATFQLCELLLTLFSFVLVW